MTDKTKISPGVSALYLDRDFFECVKQEIMVMELSRVRVILSTSYTIHTFQIRHPDVPKFQNVSGTGTYKESN